MKLLLGAQTITTFGNFLFFFAWYSFFDFFSQILKFSRFISTKSIIHPQCRAQFKEETNVIGDQTISFFFKSKDLHAKSNPDVALFKQIAYFELQYLDSLLSNCFTTGPVVK